LRIIRDGKQYTVVDKTEESYAVLVSFRFATFPYKRKLKLWWDKKYCTVVKETFGVTRGKIWANICSEFECYKWLTHKLKFKIPWKEPKK